MTKPYPLIWPDHIDRWKGTRQPGAFKTSLPAAMDNVDASLRRFGADSAIPVKDIVISSNVSLGNNKPADPGVAIWFTWGDQKICIPVDRYSKVEANLQAIHHVLEARRTELRHGTLALVRATFAGFVALPSPEGFQKRTWRQVMGWPDGLEVTENTIGVVYRGLARERHPDKARDSGQLMAELNVARDEALKEVGK